MDATSNHLVSSLTELRALLSSIPQNGTLYVDLEGNNLGRHGTITLISILVHPLKVTRLIDVLALGSLAFSTSAGDGRTLKSILEDPNLTKCFWDARTDADALWALYQVRLAGVIDIQLLENASRTRDKTFLCGLDKAIQYDLRMGYMERQRWMQTKDDIRKLLSTDVFSKRPLAAKTIQYCINDVEKLPDLRVVYMKKLTPAWLNKVEVETQRRLTVARSPGWTAQSKENARGPWPSGAEPRRKTLEEQAEELEEWLTERGEAQMLEIERLEASSG
ncbi:hypothetical protein VPNG_10255 [Cytospora leucostoma]|uniref:3'-5' exonuclease domain-containing protein n=1 Tax=Cytospora leucostoma TaxID=1230097 RepID=A0A423VFZ8_9PEZI|nr:hypothetical protein VPNG_10255 [Cytospora leucostoma]